VRINERIVTIKDKQKLVLRSPEAKDAGNLLNFMRRLYRESYMNLNHPAGRYDSYTIEKEETILCDFLESNQKFMIIAEHDGVIIGQLGLVALGPSFTKYSAHIGMGVKQKYQERGVGNALLKYSLKSAKENHFHRIELTVRSHNYPAIALYEKYGFEKVGTLKENAFIEEKYYDDYLYQLIL